jgi:hypothetical protein
MEVLCGARIRYTHLLVHLIAISPLALRRTRIVLSLLQLSGGSSLVYVCYRFSDQFKISNGDDFGSRAMVLMDICTMTFWVVTARVKPAPVVERRELRIGGLLQWLVCLRTLM